jgi:hypothetical protein
MILGNLPYHSMVPNKAFAKVGEEHPSLAIL